MEQTSCWWLTWTGPRTIFASFTDITSVFSRGGGESWTCDSQNGLTYNTTYHVVVQPKTGILYGATSSVHDLYQSPWMRDSKIDGGKGVFLLPAGGTAARRAAGLPPDPRVPL